MKDELMNIFLMGLGAVGMTTEKAKELQEELLKKGTEMYDSGKVANEELKHNLKDKLEDNITIIVNKKDDISNDDIIKKINSLSKEEKCELLKLLEGVTDEI